MPKQTKQRARSVSAASEQSPTPMASEGTAHSTVVFVDLGDVFPNAGERLRGCLNPHKVKPVPGEVIYGFRNEWLHGTPMLTLRPRDDATTRCSTYKLTDNNLERFKHALEARFGKDACAALLEAPESVRDAVLAARDRGTHRVLMLRFPSPDLSPNFDKKLADHFISATLAARRLAEVPHPEGMEQPDKDPDPENCGLNHVIKTMDKGGLPKRDAKKLTKALIDRQVQADLFGETADFVGTPSALLARLKFVDVRPKYYVLHALALRQPGHSETHYVYQAHVRASFLKDFCQVKRMTRDEHGNILYHQRPKIKKHIDDLAKVFGQRDQRFMASNIVLAFNRDGDHVQENRGILTPPCPCRETQVPDWPEIRVSEFQYKFLLVCRDTYKDKPLYVIDGQQRLLALEKEKYPDDFDIPIFIYGVERSRLDQRLQDDIAKINRAHPFSKSDLKGLLAARSDLDPDDKDLDHHAVVHYLNTTKEWDAISNPFYKRVNHLQIDIGTLAAERIAQMARELKDCGVIAGTREKRAQTIARWFAVVKEVFPTAWDANPSKSYLTGGVGLVTMGRLYKFLEKNSKKCGLVVENKTERWKQLLEGIEGKCVWMREASKGDPSHPWHNIQNNQTDYARVEAMLLGYVEEFLKNEAGKSGSAQVV